MDSDDVGGVSLVYIGGDVADVGIGVGVVEYGAVGC